MRVPYDTIWEVFGTQGLTNKRDIQISGITFYYHAVRNGFAGGIDWNMYDGHDIEIDGENKDGPLIITGLYKK